MFPTNSFTYCHDSLDQRKWHDHFLVSKFLIESDVISNPRIIDDGENISDHKPILMTLKTKVPKNPPAEIPSAPRPKLKWEKINKAAKAIYTQKINERLMSVPPPIYLARCDGNCHCSSDECHAGLQEDYDFLIGCLKDADSVLPRVKPGIGKDWWTEELSQLKSKSIEIHSLWRDQGCPRQGEINDERLRVRAEYKRAMRLAQSAPKQNSWDKIHQSLSQRDTNTFWKSWKQQV